MIDERISRSISPRWIFYSIFHIEIETSLARSIDIHGISEITINIVRRKAIKLVPDLCYTAFVSRRKQGYSNGHKFRPPAENSPTRPQIPSATAAASRAEQSRAILCRAMPSRAGR